MSRTQTKLDTLLAAGRAIFSKADGEGRLLTTIEKADLAAILAGAAIAKDTRDLEAKIDGLGTGSTVHAGSGRTVYLPATPSGDFGAKFAGMYGAAVQRFYGTKDFTLTEGDLSVPSQIPDTVVPDEPTIASLFGQATLTGTDKFTYVREHPYSNGATVVAKGSSKPATTLEAERVEGHTETIAHVIEDIDRVDVADSTYLVDLIGRRLRSGLIACLDTEVLNGTGEDGVHLTGVLDDSDIGSTVFNTDILTTLRDGIRDLRLAQFVPSVVVMSPGDAAVLDELRDSDVFIAGNPAGTPGSPWGLRRVESAYMSDGTALLGDFRQAVLYVREGVTILENPYSKMGTNKIDYRAELRAALAVKNGSAFSIVETGTGSG